MTPNALVAALEDIAPRRLAADWDNVGLLVEGTREVRRVFLCIDLTERVLEEALLDGADAIVAYHPPLFRGVKRLTSATPDGRVLLGCLRAGLHVYSPHTALDAATKGLCDWLLAPFSVESAVPIAPHVDDPAQGAGRVAVLATPVAMDDVVSRLKKHLGLAHVRVAGGGRPPARTVAVCPGAGGSLFEGLRDVDLLVTGEMRHHDVLARVAGGSAVVLTDHTNTERGYLPILAERIAERMGVDVYVSTVDADPLVVT